MYSSSWLADASLFSSFAYHGFSANWDQDLHLPLQCFQAFNIFLPGKSCHYDSDFSHFLLAYRGTGVKFRL